jgi:DNA uptake protein ComE-like DNA-binding protein
MTRAALSRSFLLTHKRAFATLLVLWVVAIAGVVITSINSASYRQAALGRESLARVRATWAARAGIEAAIARLEYDTQNPDTSDAYAALDDMDGAATATIQGSFYHVGTTEDGKDVEGPVDAHSKININLMSQQALMTLPYMTEDVADAIIDWVDADEDTSPLGAEIGYYQGLKYPYEPRNGPIRSYQELELVAGVLPEYVRGEDWNLNGVLDPEEDDGDLSWPPDNHDGKLDAGWSGLITCSSVDDVLAASGEARLDLTAANESDLIARCKLDGDQAKTILDYIAEAQNASLASIISQSPQQLLRSIPGIDQSRLQTAGAALTNEQLALLLDECAIGEPDPGKKLPGKLNINTCRAETLEYIPEIDAVTADAIILERAGRPQGYTSIVDLLDVAGISRRRLSQIYQYLTVRSNVYTVTSRGRDAKTGLEVEMTATLDRSSLPVVISDVIVR